MPITIAGDKEFENIPSIHNKALRINMNENIFLVKYFCGKNVITIGAKHHCICKTVFQ